MQIARQRKAATPSGKRSFTWGIQGSDMAWARPAGGIAVAIDGSGSGEPIAITASDRRRRMKPVPFTPV